MTYTCQQSPASWRICSAPPHPKEPHNSVAKPSVISCGNASHSSCNRLCSVQKLSSIPEHSTAVPHCVPAPAFYSTRPHWQLVIDVLVPCLTFLSDVLIHFNIICWHAAITLLALPYHICVFIPFPPFASIFMLRFSINIYIYIYDCSHMKLSYTRNPFLSQVH